MERGNQHVCGSQGRWRDQTEKHREKEGKEMDLSLKACLNAVGLQHHHARFISMGVHRVAHLSALTMEDYPFFGIHTMEERTRLFHLVQMIKSLDLEYESEDGHDDSGASVDEVYAVVGSSFTHDGYEDPDEDIHDDEEATKFARPSCVRRRLDFSSETTDHHQKLRSHPTGSVNVCKGNDVPVHGKGSVSPLQLEFDRRSELVFGYRENNQRTDIDNRPSHHCTRRDTKLDTVKAAARFASYTTLSPKCVSLHRQTPRSPEPVAANEFNNKTTVHNVGIKISKKEKPCTEISRNGVKPTIIYELKKRTGYNYGVPHSSLTAPNKKPEGAQRISVCVRKRPLTHAESRRGEADVVTTSAEECVIVHESKEAVDLTQYILQHRFYFDRVFGVESSNEEVYQRTAYPLVQHMLSGGNATCFAYGQTGAGKTHTMLGSSASRPGLYALAARDVFAHLSTARIRTSLLVYVSFFEIYCGHLYDLLDHRKRLFAREDGQKVVHIAGLREVWVDSVSSLLEVISHGTEERTQGMSGVNPLSSRSHALLKVQLRGPNQETAGRMWFVDLAGSERASDTKEPDRQSRMEGAEINQSLLALKECIRSLDQEQSHTPFRQSKLTQVLKDSFIGDSMTCMIANISPGHLATEHTLNTLRYADRVKELRGQGGLKGGRRGKTIPSPKHNLSHSNSSSSSSSFGPRGKSPPKKQKLGRRKEAFCPSAPNARMSTVDINLCSTPKYSGWREDTGMTGREGFGFELTPVRGWIGMGEKRHRVEETKNKTNGRSRENERRGGISGHSGSDQNVRNGLVLGQEQLHLRDVEKHLSQRKCGIHQREEECRQSAAKEEREEEKGWLQQQRKAGSNRDTWSEAEKQRERNLYSDDETQKERQRHLRQYHQQLQQFMSPSVSSFVSLLPPSTPPSLSSSNQTSLHSSTAPSSSSLSPSALARHSLKDVFDVYRAQPDVKADCNGGQSSFPNGEIHVQAMCRNNNAHGDSGGLGEHLGSGTEAGFGHDDVESDKTRAGKAMEDVRFQREDMRLAGMERRERRWAWLEKEQGDKVTGAMGTQLSNSCQVGIEGQIPTDDLPEGMWIPEGGRVQPYSGSPRQRAPAERPLSPACELINTLPTPDTQKHPSLKSQHSRYTIPNMPPPAHKCSNAPTTTQPISASITQTASIVPAEPLSVSLSDHPAYTHLHEDPDVETKKSTLPNDDSHTDSHSEIMDPLSISLLQVDDQFSTASFLRGERPSFCLPENEREADTTRTVGKERHAYAEMTRNVADDEDVEIPVSFLDLPRVKSRSPWSSDTMTAVTHREGGKGRCCTTHEHSEMANGLGEMNGQDSVSDQQVGPIIPLWTLKDLNSAQFRVVQAHWEQLEEMEALSHKEGTLLCQQPDMAFGEYVLQLEEIMERKAQCVHSVRAQLQPYLKPSRSSQAHNQ